MFLVNTFTSAESAYVIMPPMWYFDYFIVNGFVDCRVYVLVFSSDTQNVFFLDLQEAYNRRREIGTFSFNLQHGNPYRRADQFDGDHFQSSSITAPTLNGQSSKPT